MFTPMRTIAALVVVYTHAFALTGGREPTYALLHNMAGTTGVMFLVGVSGYLIAASWDRRSDWRAYWAKRMLRLMPGLLVAVAVCTFVVGPLVTTLSTGQYFGDGATYTGWAKASLLWTFNFELPGVFTDLPYAGEVNGSLWTLPLETVCYLALFAAGVLGLLGRRWVVLAVAVSATLVLLVGGVPNDDPLIPKPEGVERLLNVLRIGTLFAWGTVFYVFRDRVPMRWEIAAACVVVYLLPLPTVLHDSLATVLIPYVAVLVGNQTTPAFLERLTPGGADPSYGIYIYAFPLQQLIVHAWSDIDPWVMTAIAIPVAYLIGRISWRYVERPALALRDRFGTATPIVAPTSSSTPAAPDGKVEPPPDRPVANAPTPPQEQAVAP
jgi:peptidoglycan/LPS O-acetylase OafA/YrhL